MVLATVKAVTARRTKSRKTDGGRRRHRRLGLPEGHVLQPAVPGAAAASRASSAVLFGKVELFNGRRQMTNPVVDLVGDKTGRIVPDVPAVGEGRRDELGHRQVDDRGARRGPGTFADPVPAAVLRPVGPRSTAPRPSTTSTSPRPWPRRCEARRRLVFDELLRVQLQAGAAQARARAHDPGHQPRRRRATLVHRFHERLPFPLTGAQRAGHRRDRRTTWPARTRCTGCCRATSARARPSWR